MSLMCWERAKSPEQKPQPWSLSGQKHAHSSNRDTWLFVPDVLPGRSFGKITYGVSYSALHQSWWIFTFPLSSYTKTHQTYWIEHIAKSISKINILQNWRGKDNQARFRVHYGIELLLCYAWFRVMWSSWKLDCGIKYLVGLVSSRARKKWKRRPS